MATKSAAACAPDATTARLPIMMLTAQESVEEKVRGFEAGADDYMTKPFQPPELQARVKVLLRRALTTEGGAAQLAGKIIAGFRCAAAWACRAWPPIWLPAWRNCGIAPRCWWTCR